MTERTLDSAYLPAKALVWADFSLAPDGPLTAADSGQSWHLATTPGNAAAELEVINGFMTNTASLGGGASAGHAMVDLGAETSRIGAEFAFAPGNGVANGGAAALVLWSVPLVYPGPVVDSPMHITFDTKTWNLATFVGGSGTTIATGAFLKPLATDGTLYTVEISVKGETATILLPDGRTITVTDPRIAAKARTVPSWETYQIDASVDPKAKFRKVWADAGLGDFTAAHPTIPQMISHTKRALDAALTSTASHPAAAAGNVALTIPTTATEIDPALRVSFIAPQSGKVLLTLNGQINQTAAGDIQWTVLVPEAGGTYLRLASKIVQEQVITVTILVTGLTPGNLYSTRWQHRATGTSAGVLRLNAAAGQLAIISAQPVN